MTGPGGVWPDVEAGLIDALHDLAPGGVETPANLTDRLPFLRVRRIGGGDDGFTDAAVVDVDAFGATRQSAYDLAQAVRIRLVDNPPAVPGFVVDRVTVTTAPQELPHDNPRVTRFLAVYRVTTRRQ